MRKHLLKKTMTVACAVLALSASAQGVSRENLGESLKTPISKISLKKQANVEFKQIALPTSNVSTRADEVSYVPSKGIYCLLQELDGYVNFLSFNRKENNYTSETSFNYLITPKDSLVGYYNTSTKSGSSSWAIPGGDPETSTDQDAIVTYPTAGTYAFPTLNIGGSKYTADGKIVAGGKGEIILADCYSLGETFSPMYLQYNENNGYPTGSSTSNTEAFGNLFALPQEAEVSAVNVYIGANPKAKDPNNKVKMSIYAPDFSSGEVDFEATLIASAELKVSEMMADAREITGLVAEGDAAFMGMASFKLAKPVNVGSLFFVSISNFGNDVSKGEDDFVIMSDALTPNLADPKLVFNYSSFLKGEAQDGSIRWFPLYPSVFEGAEKYFPNANTNLLICPVIDYTNAGTGINNVKGEVSNKVFAAEGTLSLTSEVANEAGIYTVSGQLIQSVSLNDGSKTVSTSGWAKGVYVVKFANGENVKVII